MSQIWTQQHVKRKNPRPFFISFREKPDVKQEEYTRVIDISWQEATLDRAKCVDFYFVEFAELPNGTYPGEEPGTWLLPTLDNFTTGKAQECSLTSTYTFTSFKGLK